MSNLADLPTQSDIVSSEAEHLILVNTDDQELGSNTKEACHNGEGILHRAFSVFLFNQNGELLLQQRSGEKRLWPLYWSNSCCSHPRVGEAMGEAALRRMRQELGVSSNNLKYLYKFHYQATFGPQGSEHELCSVYVGNTTDEIVANINEVSDWRFIKPTNLNKELDNTPNLFTPWFKMEWRQLLQNHENELALLGVDVDSSR